MYVGIDGGQTKTVGVILSAEGEILAQREIGGMPFNGELTENFLRQFRELLEQLCEKAMILKSEIKQFCGGLCGIDNEQQKVEKAAILSKALTLPKEKITLVNDAIIALWAGTNSPAALLLQHGTAFTSAVRDSNGVTRLFDSTDIGRIFDIRQELLILVARMIDGRKNATPLKEKLLQFFHIEDEKEFGFVIDYEIVPLEKQRATVELIRNAWLEGDIEATQLIDSAAEDYAGMIKVMLNQCTNEEISIVMGGGLLNRLPDSFFELCRKHIHTEKQIHFCRPALKPVLGAALYAAARDGFSASELFEKLCSYTNKSEDREVSKVSQTEDTEVTQR